MYFWILSGLVYAFIIRYITTKDYPIVVGVLGFMPILLFLASSFEVNRTYILILWLLSLIVGSFFAFHKYKNKRQKQ